MVNFTHENIHGIVVPLVTPLIVSPSDNSCNVDEYALGRMIYHVVGNFEKPLVDAIFVNSLTGEFPWIGHKNQLSMLEHAVDACSRRIPVLFGATGKTIDETEELCYLGQKFSADALVVAPLYFCRKNSELANSMPKILRGIRLPVYLYNNPTLALSSGTNVDISISDKVLKELLKIDNVWGIKDSSGDLGLFKSYCEAAEHKPGARVFMGDESNMVLSDNVVPSFANLDSMLCRKLIDSKDMAEKMKLQEMINHGGKIIYCDYEKIRGGLKYALRCMGIIDNPRTAEPGQELTQGEKDSIAGYVMSNYLSLPRNQPIPLDKLQ